MEKKSQRIYKIIMLVVLTAFITFMITSLSMYKYIENNTIYGLLKSSQASSFMSSSKESSSSDVDSYLKKIKSAMESYYLWNDKIDDQALKDGAVEGYVAALGDEYTEYIPSSEMENYTEAITGSFYGIGIYMVADEESGRVVVYYPIPETPAEKAGIKPGDKIIKVDGNEYTSKDLSDISKYIKGEAGTKVNLVIERDGEELSFDIERAKINTNPITTEILEGNIGYIKLPSFDTDVAKNFKQKYQELQEKGAKSLIIDLRNNGGGIVDEATEIADYILDKGETIISTVDNKENKKVTTSENEPIIKTKIAILVNENTASASEILACSLKDNDKATVIGTKTYGKGVIQTVFSLSDGSGLKITTAEYYTPKGETIHKVGITPNIEVKIPENVKNPYSLSKEEDTQLKKAIEELGK